VPVRFYEQVGAEGARPVAQRGLRLPEAGALRTEFSFDPR